RVLRPPRPPLFPYTTLFRSCPQPDVGVSIWATDIDTNAIQRAREGVYPQERVKPVPEDYLHKYFQRGTGRRAGLVRVKDSLRSLDRKSTRLNSSHVKISYAV